jgi:hypothetical protein
LPVEQRNFFGFFINFLTDFIDSLWLVLTNVYAVKPSSDSAMISERAGEELWGSSCSFCCVFIDCLGLLRNGREKNGFNLRSKRLSRWFFSFSFRSSRRRWATFSICWAIFLSLTWFSAWRALNFTEWNFGN